MRSIHLVHRLKVVKGPLRRTIFSKFFFRIGQIWRLLFLLKRRNKRDLLKFWCFSRINSRFTSKTLIPVGFEQTLLPFFFNFKGIFFFSTVALRYKTKHDPISVQNKMHEFGDSCSLMNYLYNSLAVNNRRKLWVQCRYP